MDEVTEASVAHAIVNEQAHTQSDIQRRRLSVGWGPDLGRCHAETTARLAASHLGWTQEDMAAQVTAFLDETSTEFSFQGN